MITRFHSLTTLIVISANSLFLLAVQCVFPQESAAAQIVSKLTSGSFTVPGGNILAGITPTENGATGINGWAGNTGSITVLTNGVMGPNWNGPGSFTSNNEYMVGDGTAPVPNNGTNTWFTVTLPVPYTITQVNTYTAWNFDRIDQRYGVYTSTDGTTFTSLLDTVNVPWALGTGGEMLVELNGFSVPNVKAIRWLFDASQPAGFAGYAELAAFGEVTVAGVPEPSTYALGLIGLAGLGLVAWRRRKGLQI